jgi:outer membrane receptor for ferrienterochelin and colicins
MKFKLYLFITYIIFPGWLTTLNAQTIKGVVCEKDTTGKEFSLPGANVYHVSGNPVTTTDANGKFSLQLHEPPAKIVVSFVGYKNDTIEITEAKDLKIFLRKSLTLKEVSIEGKQASLTLSTVKPINIETITGKELLKAACCNLSESFETNPTVNVSYTDAITGAKEIRMLGLSGIYSQLLTENIPLSRGLASSFGLTFIPGPWIESIQITKGTGSVVNGYESTTGQINIEIKKPETAEKFYLNLYEASTLNSELNMYHSKKINKKWNEMLLVHGNWMQKKWDDNNDGFLDLPLTKELAVANRWRYHSGKNLESQLGVKLLLDERNGGQLSFNEARDKGTMHAYGTGISTKRLEAYAKVGLVFPEKPDKSFGSMYAFVFHDQDAYFGLKSYNATQKNFYANLIYQNIFGNKNNAYKTGISFQADFLNENFKQDSISVQSDTTEITPGAFYEYTLNAKDKFTAVAGLRSDYHSGYGWFVVPRLHLKYNFTPDLILRASGGRSFLRPHPLADNISLLASSREIVFSENIEPEIAWNYGANLTAIFDLFGRETTFNIDYYRTFFTNQLIADSYSDSLNILFYNLNGESFSNSLQTTLNLELAEGLTLRLAYKNDDVRSTYNGKLESKPLVAMHKALVNVAWEPNVKWKFDYTLLWEGKKKLAYSTIAGNENIPPAESPEFVTMNAQVTRVFKKWEVYAGAENLTDFTQDNPIISPENPFSNTFDATNIWGPIMGRKIYAGIRYSIKH